MKENKRVCGLIITVTIAIVQCFAQSRFEDYFMEKTMRFDYYHAGDAQSEYYFADEVIEEPYWAGNKNYLIDSRNVGNQQFRILDKTTGKVIYSRGYNTLFNEWQTTPEAQTTSKAMPEGFTFPYPKQDIICLGINYYAHAEESARFHEEAFGG